MTTHPTLARILRAQKINRLSGGALVAPWEVDELSDEWLDAYAALDRDLPARQEAQAKVAAAFARFRAAHPTYRKH